MESIFPFTKSLEANCHLRSFSSLAKCFSLSSFNSLMSPRGLARDQNPLPRLITTPRPAITITHWLVLAPPLVLRAAMSCPLQFKSDGDDRLRRSLLLFHKASVDHDIAHHRNRRTAPHRLGGDCGANGLRYGGRRRHKRIATG